MHYDAHVSGKKRHAGAGTVAYTDMPPSYQAKICSRLEVSGNQRELILSLSPDYDSQIMR